MQPDHEGFLRPVVGDACILCRKCEQTCPILHPPVPGPAPAVAHAVWNNDEAERLADEGQFGKGSMEPKVRAAIKFARSRKGRTCIIGALDKAAETMAGLSGTRIHE